jgi:uncharacterized membrane protein YphA (DoxX/SURF4 family)
VELAATTGRFVLGSLFLLAGVAKVRRRADFAEVVAGYKFAPRLVDPTVVARWLPWLEAVGGALLLVGALVRPTSVAVGGLLAGFTALVAFNLLRGREIDCGCLGDVVASRISWFHVIQNIALIGFAILVAVVDPRSLAFDSVIGGARAGSASTGFAAAIAATLLVALLMNATVGWRLQRASARLASFKRGEV